MQANENSKLADSSGDKLAAAEKKPAGAEQKQQPQHTDSANGISHNPAHSFKFAGLQGNQSQVPPSSEQGEVGVNGYNVHESAPRRQPADVSTQCIAFQQDYTRRIGFTRRKPKQLQGLLRSRLL